MKARSLDNLTEHWPLFCLGPVPSQANFPGSVEEVFGRTVSFKVEHEQVIGLATEAVLVTLRGLDLDEPSILGLGVVKLRKCRQEL